MCYIFYPLPRHFLWLLSPPWPLPPLLLLIPSIYFLSFYCHTLIDSPASSLSSHPTLHVLSLLPSLAPSSLPIIQSTSSTSQIDFTTVLRSPINSQIGFPTYPLPLAFCIFFFFHYSLFHSSILFPCLLSLICPAPSFFCYATSLFFSLTRTLCFPICVYSELFVNYSRGMLVCSFRILVIQCVYHTWLCVWESETETVWENVFMQRHASHQMYSTQCMGLCNNHFVYTIVCTSYVWFCPCILQFVCYIVCIFWYLLISTNALTPVTTAPQKSHPHREAPSV